MHSENDAEKLPNSSWLIALPAAFKQPGVIASRKLTAEFLVELNIWLLFRRGQVLDVQVDELSNARARLAAQAGRDLCEER